MKRNKKAAHRPSGWQLDPNALYSANVQYWRNGVMASVISVIEAKRLVTIGAAFVMCEQAIGAMVDGVSKS